MISGIQEPENSLVEVEVVQRNDTPLQNSGGRATTSRYHRPSRRSGRRVVPLDRPKRPNRDFNFCSVSIDYIKVEGDWALIKVV